jgi:hypothetical protein
VQVFDGDRTRTKSAQAFLQNLTPWTENTRLSEREEAIININVGMKEVESIASAVQTLVLDQSASLDLIIKHVEETRDTTKEGLREIQHAANIQKGLSCGNNDHKTMASNCRDRRRGSVGSTNTRSPVVLRRALRSTTCPQNTLGACLSLEPERALRSATCPQNTLGVLSLEPKQMHWGSMSDLCASNSGYCLSNTGERGIMNMAIFPSMDSLNGFSQMQAFPSMELIVDSASWPIATEAAEVLAPCAHGAFFEGIEI